MTLKKGQCQKYDQLFILRDQCHSVTGEGPLYFSLTLCMLGNSPCFYCRLLTFFKINFFKILFQEHYQSVKQSGSRSGLTFCLLKNVCPEFGSKLCTKIISRRQTLPLAGRVKTKVLWLSYCTSTVLLVITIQPQDSHFRTSC